MKLLARLRRPAASGRGGSTRPLRGALARLGVATRASMASALVGLPFALPWKRPARPLDLIVGIPFRAASTTKDWSMCCALLEETIRSVLRMKGAQILVVIAGHDKPDIPVLADPRVMFVTAPFPVTRGGSTRDKQRKKNLIGEVLKGRLSRPTWFMFVDADDRVHPQLATYLNSLDADACVFVSGFVFDANEDVVALLSGNPPFFEWCGTSFALRLSEADLHDTADGPAFVTQLQNHRLFAATTEAAGRRCEYSFCPLVGYVVGTGISLTDAKPDPDGRNKRLHAVKIRRPDFRNRVLVDFGFPHGREISPARREADEPAAHLPT